MPEATPAQLIEAAVSSGHDLGGMWVEQDDWSDRVTRAVRKQLSDSGLKLLDVEVAWIKPGDPDPWLDQLVDIAAELGSPNLLCVSSDPEDASTAAKLQRLLDRAKGTGVRINLEFGLFTEVKSIGQARAIVDRLDGTGKGILCDTLHWSRSGGTAQAIADLPGEWVGYAQLCDAPAAGPDLEDMDDIIEDAVDRRMALGRGGLDIAAMLSALPADLPVSVEERSAALRENFPDLNDRAREVARTSRAWLAQHDNQTE